jgi:hypothetical protein
MKSLIEDVVNRVKDRRNDPRYGLSGALPGEIRDKNGVVFSVMLVDISKRGLGLLIDPAPEVGSVLTLCEENSGNEDTLQLVVRHVHNSQILTIHDLQNMKRCGLEILQPKQGELDLIQRFSTCDMLLIQE